MSRNIGRNINVDDTAIVNSMVETTDNNALTVLDANPDRLYVAISIKGQDAFIRFIPAATDTSERKGIFIKKDNTYELPTDNIYTGEISVINSRNNRHPEIYVTEF